MPIDLPPIEFSFKKNISQKDIAENTLRVQAFNEMKETYEKDFMPADTIIPAVEDDTIFLKNIADRVKKIVVNKLGVEETEVNAKASFTNDLGADSLDTVELIMEFEKEFNISIADEDAEKIITIGDAVIYIQQKIKAIK